MRLEGALSLGCPRKILLWHFTLEDENITLFQNVRISLTTGAGSYPRRTEFLEELIKVKFSLHTLADPIHLLVSTTLRPLYPWRKDRYPLYRRLFGSWGLYGRHEKSEPAGIRPLDHPACSDALYRLRYPCRQEKLICFFYFLSFAPYSMVIVFSVQDERCHSVGISFI